MKIPIGEKLLSYLEQNPEDYDVTFVVGEEKTEVKGLKIVLKAASSLFECEFKQQWDQARFKLENPDGIPLPDLNSTAFQIFMNLIISDTWSTEAVKGLPLRTLLDLSAACRKFDMMVELQIVEEVVDELLPLFDSLMVTEEFLKLSKENLEAILSSELIPMDEIDIFEGVQRWAEFQCDSKGMDLTGANLRSVLGSSLFQIRFPTMSITQFKKCTAKKNFLTAEEMLEVFNYISLTEEEKANFDADEDQQYESEDQILSQDQAKLKFNRKHRTTSFRYSTFNLTKDCAIVDNPGFVCDGHWPHDFTFKANRKIALQSIGFLGPIELDSIYNVEVEVARIDKFFARTHSTGKMEKKIHAQKGRVFHFVLDHPITLDSITSDSLYEDAYSIRFSLLGANTLMAVKKTKTFGQGSSLVQSDGFCLRWNGHQSGDQIAELRFMEL